MKGIQVVGRSGWEVECAAARARRVLMPDSWSGEAVDGVELFEHALEEHGRKLTGGSDVTYAVETLPRGIEGYTQYDADANCFYVTLSEGTYHRLVREDSRALFTLVHEVGHLALHRGTMKRLKQLPHRELMLERSRDHHPPYEDSEWQANRFASAMLMPALGLERLRAAGKLDDEHVVRNYLTSYTAAELRLREFSGKRERLLQAWK